MKKFIAFLMALLMVASLAGCKSDAPEAVVVEAGAVRGAETAEHNIASMKYEGTVLATEGKDADDAEVSKATKVTEVTEGTVAAEAINGANEGIGSTESTTYGGNGGGAVQPTKQTSDSGFSKPSGGYGYGYEVIVDETEPTVPATELTKPTGEEPAPTEPTKPTEPSNPVDPVKPTEPSADYSEPVVPSEGETPTEPTQPSDPCPDQPEEPTEHVHCWTCVHEDEEWRRVRAVQCTCGVVFETRDGTDPMDLWIAHVASFSGREQLDHYACFDCNYDELVKNACDYWWCPSCNTRSDTNPNP